MTQDAPRAEGIPGPGDMIAGRYRVDEQIGKGGMGVVFRATQLPLGRAVAVKIILPNQAQQGEMQARFEREARVTSALRHPGSVQVFDFGVDDGRLFLVMELLLGEPLAKRMVVGQPLPLAMAVDITRQVADVLLAAHDISLVHRDLKPENIFIERDRERERVKVVDFGLAFILEDDGDMGRMTREGIISGTPAYISPEQAQAKGIREPTDIYSLGCVLFEMLAGFTPYSGTPGELIASHMYVPAPRLKDLRIDVPRPLEQLLDSMLHKEPDRRPTATSVRDQLLEFIVDPTERAAVRKEARHARMVPETVRIDGTSNPLIEFMPDGSSVVTSSADVGDRADLNAGRAGRMVTNRVDSGTQQGLYEREKHDIAIVGHLEHALHIALATNSLNPVHCENGLAPQNAKAVLVLDATASVEDLTRHVKHGKPVVAVASPDDMDRIAQLLRLGVAEVVPLPLDGGDVARKLGRALKRRTRPA